MITLIVGLVIGFVLGQTNIFSKAIKEIKAIRKAFVLKALMLRKKQQGNSSFDFSVERSDRSQVYFMKILNSSDASYGMYPNENFTRVIFSIDLDQSKVSHKEGNVIHAKFGRPSRRTHKEGKVIQGNFPTKAG